NGYSLYVQNNALIWLVKQNGQAYQVRTTNLPNAQFAVTASLLDGGEMTLEINGKNVGKGKAPALFPAALNPQRVRTGNDNLGENNVGEYANNFWFRGRMGRESSLALRDPSLASTAGQVATGTASGSSSTAGAVVIKMGVIPHEMKFDKANFKVRAGQQVTIDFENQDFMQHNLLVIQKGSLEKVGKAADDLARDPKGAEQQYVPKMPEVIVASRLVDPEGNESLVFTAPSEPGDYPYICTVPGHWRIMNGIMTVE